jgi:hypothetical protein
VQGRQGQVRVHRQGVDAQVRHGIDPCTAQSSKQDASYLSRKKIGA